MADIRVSIGPLHSLVDEYVKLFKQAEHVDIDKGAGQREPIHPDTLRKILTSLDAASVALLEGCQQTVYGLFLTPKE